MKLQPIVSAVLAACSAAPALAWNARGHELAAYIAYQDLKPAQRAALSGILKQHPQYDKLAEGCPEGFDKDCYAFMRASTWPDMIRDTANPMHTEHHSQWHYINFPVEPGGAASHPEPPTAWSAPADPENIVQALAKCQADVLSPATEPKARAVALCWVLHLAGDIHQPLHTTAFFSADFPKGDQGGNLFWVESHGRPVKLHAFWDDILGSSDSASEVAGQAKGLVQKFTRQSLAGPLSSTSIVSWARETLAIGKSEGYRDGKLQGLATKAHSEKPPSAPALPADYQTRARAAAERQIVLAGYRMADQLNAMTVSGR